MRRIGCLLFLCGYSGLLFSYIYEIQVLRKWLSTNARYQYVIGLSDFHDRNVIDDVRQRTKISQQLIDARSKIQVIVEDLCSPNFQGRNGCEQFTLNPRGGVLAQIAQELQKAGVTVDNVEYRYCRVVALGQLLSQKGLRITDCAYVQQVRIVDLLTEIQQLIDELQAMKSKGAWWFRRFKQAVRRIKQQIDALKLDQYQDKTIAAYMHSFQAQERLDVLRKLLTLDTDLIDLLMVRAVLKSDATKNIVLCGGGTHVRNVCQWLTQHVGYQRTNQTGVHTFQERDLSKCHPGAHIIDRTYCVKPYPISDEVLDKVLALLQMGR